MYLKESQGHTDLQESVFLYPNSLRQSPEILRLLPFEEALTSLRGPRYKDRIMQCKIARLGATELTLLSQYLIHHAYKDRTHKQNEGCIFYNSLYI